MGEYQRKRGKYILPGTVYMKTIYQIRDYYRLKEKIQDTIDESPDPHQPHVSGSKKGSPTESKAFKIYRDGVWASVMFNEPYPQDADRTTYGRHKSRFVFTVAAYLGWV